jgi:glycopeptide antibiotics resistance protein
MEPSMGTRNRLRQNFDEAAVMPDPSLRTWANRIIGGAILIILVATLSPFEFTAEGVTLKGAIRDFFAHPSDLSDVVGNVFLFMPLGFGIALRERSSTLQSESFGARQRQRRGLNLYKTLAVAAIASMMLSLGVEIVQVFLPARCSSWIDICTNTTGGFCGAFSYFCWTAIAPNQLQSFAKHVRRLLTIQNLAIVLSAWVVMTGLVSLSLQQAAHLSNWNPSFPLLLGNEATGDRPWNGTISAVEISDRALSESEIAQVLQRKSSLPRNGLVASYDLGQTNSSSSLNDVKDGTGNLSDLVAHASPLQVLPEGVKLTNNQWLSTAQPATVLSDRLRKSSEFTISTIAATANQNQNGPARILSLSADPFHRNFTLGQQNDYLVFRLRTPITGENGVYTALFVPNVFRDSESHRFLLTYHQNVLHLYVDNVQNSYTLELTPEITLFRYLFPFEGRIIQLTSFSVSVHKLMFYSVFFVPLGFILALISARFKQQIKLDILLVATGIFIPALLLELILRNGQLQFGNLALSISIALATMMLIKGKVTGWLYSSSKI